MWKQLPPTQGYQGASRRILISCCRCQAGGKIVTSAAGWLFCGPSLSGSGVWCVVAGRRGRITVELLNATRFKAGYTMGMMPDGRELLVVVVKGTFQIPDRPDDEPQLSGEQLPLIEADAFSGEPGRSAPIYESDFAPFKPRCDVLLTGSAYSHDGTPIELTTVSLRIGSLYKSFDVVGNRRWRKRLLGFLRANLNRLWLCRSPMPTHSVVTMILTNLQAGTGRFATIQPG